MTFSRDDAVLTTAYLLAAVALVAVLELHLLIPLLAGLLVYDVIHVMTPLTEKYISDKRGKLIAVAILGALVVGILTSGIVGAIAFFRSDDGSFIHLSHKLSRVIEDARASLPPWLLTWLPANGADLQKSISDWTREHTVELRNIGRETITVLAQTLIAMVVGAMIAMHQWDEETSGPLGEALADRARRLAEAFRRIVFSQARISLINTTFTAIYLVVVLPLLGVHLPLTKTMIAVTFIVGMLPVIGNLISNSMIVTVSLAHSFDVAVGSLVFLIVIHKLEYFLNARIIGSRIEARAWELLLAMVAMEAMFGVAGLVAAPIYYAFLKRELVCARLISRNPEDAEADRTSNPLREVDAKVRLRSMRVGAGDAPAERRRRAGDSR